MVHEGQDCCSAVVTMPRAVPTPRRRNCATPRGMAELDIAGTERQAFVTVTVFGEDGWVTDEEMRWSRHDEGLVEHLAGLTGMSPA